MTSKHLAGIALVFGLTAFAAACAPSPTTVAATQIPASMHTPTRPPSPTSTPTATATATATLTATPMPTATRTPTPGPGDVLLTDPFDDNRNLWSTFAQADAAGQLRDGVLAMDVRMDGAYYRIGPRRKYADLDLTFDVTIRSGEAGNTMFGAYCRYRDSDDAYYAFLLNDRGDFAVDRVIGDKITTLRPWTWSNAVRTGLATNAVRVICSGERLVFSVNDRVLISLADAQADRGWFGVLAGTFEAKRSVVEFDNLQVALPGELPEPETTSGGGTPPGATRPPAATPTPSQPRITIVNNTTIGVRFDFWGPTRITVDIPAGESRTLDVPGGAYGWTSFLLQTNCQLNATENLIVEWPVTLWVNPHDSPCGAYVSGGS